MIIVSKTIFNIFQKCLTKNSGDKKIYLNKYYKENIFIEINEAYSNQNFIFYNNSENKEQQNIDFYKELNDAENTLLSTNPFSEVYKLNTCNQDYKIQNEGFYNILDTCKTIYYCSDKTFAPMEYLNTQEKNINTTNFDYIQKLKLT